MYNAVEIIGNPNRNSTKKGALLERFSINGAEEIHSFHKSFPGYAPTPLYNMKNLAKTAGVKKIWIKDESKRFSLNAFKVLGASYAVAAHLKELYSIDEPLTYSLLKNEKIRELVKDVTLVSATDGNHGRGVAWTARQLGCKAEIYMPKGSSVNRLNNIKSHGANAFIIEGSYDDAVNLASEYAAKNGWILVQDSAREGYESIPLNIMRGYLTIMQEIFALQIDDIPTHVLIQCGVGAFPAAALAYLVNRFGENKIIFSTVEPPDAACVFESARQNKLSSLTNEMHTIMAGLACGTPCRHSWEIFKEYSDFFIKCTDEFTIKGMRLLGSGSSGDEKIISGESGAVTAGLISSLRNGFPEEAAKLSLNEDSKVLIFSTEGNTDPDSYNRILLSNN